MPDYTPDKIEELASSLKGLPPVERRRPDRISGRDVIYAVLPDIKEAMKRGYTLNAIMEHLASHGVTLKASTVRGYIYGNGAPDAQERPAKRKAAPNVVAEERHIA